jgi:hypothetical protein
MLMLLLFGGLRNRAKPLTSIVTEENGEPGARVVGRGTGIHTGLRALGIVAMYKS